MRIGINAWPPISAHLSLLPNSSSKILPGKIRGAANSRDGPGAMSEFVSQWRQPYIGYALLFRRLQRHRRHGTRHVV